METPYERSRIERAKRELYDPKGSVAPRAPELSPTQIDTSDVWERQNDVLRHLTPPPRRPLGVFVAKALIVTAIFVVGFSLLYLFYTYVKGTRNSPENIVLTPDMPVSVTSGVDNALRLVVENKNRERLNGVILTVKYPDGTKKSDGVTDLTSDTKIFGDIDAGQLVSWDGHAIFFGKENDDIEVTFVVSYRFEGISSTFERSVSHRIRVNTAPVNVLVRTLDEVNSGQPMDMTIVVASNATIPLSPLLLKIDYPQGFTYLDATPAPFVGNAIWSIDALAPGEKFEVRLRGILDGPNGQKRAFRFTTGPKDQRSSTALGSEYSNVVKEIALRQSFIGVDLFLDDRPAGDSIGNFGQRIKGKVLWKNNLSAKVIDAEIEVKLKGSALDRKSIRVEDGGYYRSLDNTITWDKRNTPALSVLEGGDQGYVQFSFLPLPSVTGSEILRNPSITVEISVRAKRISETGVPEEVKTLAVRNVRVTSEIQFASKVLHTIGPIANRGPIPPKVETETTYTIVFSLINSSNDVNGVVVRGVIPPFVRYTGSVSPPNENIVYNDATKEVVWSPGSVPAGTGITTRPREVYFQVSLTPSLSQEGNYADLLYSQSLSAQDAFTGAEIRQQRSKLTTELMNDPNIPRESGRVVR